MVGGLSNVPIIRDTVSKYFNNRVILNHIKPDQAIVHGLTVQSAVLLGQIGSQPEIICCFGDVCTINYGIQLADGTMEQILQRNTTIPCVKVQTFTTQFDYQTDFTIEVYTGMRLFAADNQHLGSLTLNGIYKAKRGVPRIQVKFYMDPNDVLTVTVSEVISDIQ